MVQRIKKQNTYIDYVKNMVKVHKTTIKNGNNVIGFVQSNEMHGCTFCTERLYPKNRGILLWLRK